MPACKNLYSVTHNRSAHKSKAVEARRFAALDSADKSQAKARSAHLSDIVVSAIVARSRAGFLKESNPRWGKRRGFHVAVLLGLTGTR